MEEASDKEVTQEESVRQYTNAVYEPTPSSGSGGGEEEEEEEERPTRRESADQIKALDQLLQPPHQDSREKVSDWVNQVSSEDAANPPEEDGGTQKTCDEEGGDVEMETNSVEDSDKVKGEGEEEKTETVDDTPKTFKVFVSNLPPGLAEPELREMFVAFGEVTECELFAKSYAFVFMTCEEDTTKAIEGLNGVVIRGCKINVKRSVQSGASNVKPKPKVVKAPPKPKPKPEPAPEPEPGCEIGTFKIYIGNLPDEVKKEDVVKLLEPYGRTVEVEIYRDTSAFVHMETEESAKKAIEELTGQTLPECEKPLNVSASKNPEGPTMAVFKLQVTNLPGTVPPEEVRELFKPYGLVLKVAILPRLPTEPRTAIVHLEQFGNVRSAIKELDGKEIGDSAIKVAAYVEKPKYTPVAKQQKPNRSVRPVFDRRPVMRPEPPLAVRPGPNGMRLIPMPSESELQQMPRSGRGRRLLNPDAPPPPLMTQQPFGGVLRRPGARGRGNFSQESWGQNDSQWGQGYDEGWGNDGGWGHGNDGGWGQNEDPWSQGNSWGQNDNRGFGQNDWGYEEEDESEDCDVFDYSQANQGWGGNYGGPPNKKQKQQPWQNSGNQFGGRNMSNNGNNSWGNQQNPQRNNGNNNNNRQNPGNSKGQQKKGMFPEFPKQNQFPKGRQGQNMKQKSNETMNTDWSADVQIPSYSQYEDFTKDVALPGSSTHAVPFDYSQMKKKKPAGNNNANWQANQSFTYSGGNQQQRGGGGGGGGGAGKNNKKGKSRRPGLGTPQQQKKTANQSGNAEPLGPWTPVEPSSYGASSTATSSSSNSYAPYYSQPQQQNNRYFSKPAKKAPKKTLKEIEEEQKRQYADYLKQKPWLYQAIPGTVKKVNH